MEFETASLPCLNIKDHTAQSISLTNWATNTVDQNEAAQPPLITYQGIQLVEHFLG